jgi:hypothetical protein
MALTPAVANSNGEKMQNVELGKDEGGPPIPIRVKFQGGPLHDLTALVISLPQCQIHFDQRQRQVFCYNRTDELVYELEVSVSKALTEQYDIAYHKFGGTGSSIQSWDKHRRT